MIFFIHLYFILTVSGYKKFEIIAVGDSVTWGAFSSDMKTKSYPPQLEKILNAEFKQSSFEHTRNPIVVKNFGLPAKTLADFSKDPIIINKQINDGIDPYKRTGFWDQLMHSMPDVVIFMLGTNDSRMKGWNKKVFKQQFKETINQIRKLKSKPLIFVSIPVPLYPGVQYGLNPNIINKIYPALIPEIAKELKIPSDQIIDQFHLLGGHRMNKKENYFCKKRLWVQMRRVLLDCDAIHPTDVGYLKMAYNAFDVLTSNQKFQERLRKHLEKEQKYLEKKVKKTLDYYGRISRFLKKGYSV